MGLYNFKGLFCPRTIGRTIESRDNGLISGWAYNRDFTVFCLYILENVLRILCCCKTVVALLSFNYFLREFLID